MELQLRVSGEGYRWSHGGATGVLDLAAGDLDGWAERYRRAVRARLYDLLPELGRDMLAALGSGWSIDPWLAAAAPALTVLSRPGAEDAALARSLLLAPWELLADGAGFLAQNPTRLFTVARRIGDAGAPWKPLSRDFSLLFMAASPEGASDLDHEGEEAAILEATRTLTTGAARTYVVVEELGARDAMGERLRADGPFEAAHLSCHGTVHPELGPVLALEAETGGVDLTGPEQLLQEFGAGTPPLVFVSACLTAAARGDELPPDPQAPEQTSGHTAALSELAESYVVRLVRAGVASVVGWEGSVLDSDATDFASAFYGALTRGEPVAAAAARARGELLRRNAANRQQGRDWHLARVYLGPAGGGALTARNAPKRPRPSNEGAFLDQENRLVPVASRAAFVGRRRLLQAVLRAFAAGESVLLHGMGNLGKSSLAARIASRLRHLKPVVLYEHNDAASVFDALLAAVPAEERDAVRNRWQAAVGASDAALGPALKAMLGGPLDAGPVLLIVDDLERVVLEPPSPARPRVEPRPQYRDTLAAILQAFAAGGTDSRLLITSRYRFGLPDGGRDLASRLVDVPLRPMSERERAKQWSAAARLARRPEVEEARAATDGEIQEDTGRFNDVRWSAQDAAAGNPGLQELLTRPLLAADPDIAAVEAATRAVEQYRETGEVPAEASAADEFFRRVSMQNYRDALTDDQHRALQACTLFGQEVPIPHASLAAAIAAAGVVEAEGALERLLALGLLDNYDAIYGQPHAAVNLLARPLVPVLKEADAQHLAAAALPVLAAVWRDEDGDFPWSPLSVEAARLALVGDTVPGILDAAVRVAAAWLFHKRESVQSALALIHPAFKRLETIGAHPTSGLLRIAATCSGRIGNTQFQDKCLRLGLNIADLTDRERANFLADSADRMTMTGDIERAIIQLTDARKLYDRAGDPRSVAAVIGRIADIRESLGQIDEATHLRRLEELPIHIRLGDARGWALTMGSIADTLEKQGNIDESIRIRREDQLPIFRKIGDIRSIATTELKLSETLFHQGDIDRSYKILTEQVLPQFEFLGDIRLIAMAKSSIADIFQARGQLHESLRLRLDDVIPVYERFGDLRSKAAAMGSVASIYRALGEIDEALRIHKEDQLAIYEKLGNLHEAAATKLQIAEILQLRGVPNEALRMINEEVLPVFGITKNERSKAIALGKVAELLRVLGKNRESLKIFQEEVLPTFQKLKDPQQEAVVLGNILDIMDDLGMTTNSMQVRLDTILPIYKRIGDTRAQIITMGKVAKEMERRGTIQEALSIHQSRLTLARQLGDIEIISHALFDCGSTRIRMPDEKRQNMQTIRSELEESFNICVKIGRLDGVGRAGTLLGLTLGYLKETRKAKEVLGIARSASEKIGDMTGVAAANNILRVIKKESQK